MRCNRIVRELAPLIRAMIPASESAGEYRISGLKMIFVDLYGFEGDKKFAAYCSDAVDRQRSHRGIGKDGAPISAALEQCAREAHVAVRFMTSAGEALGHAIEPLARSGCAKRGRRLQQQLARCRKGSKRRSRVLARLAAFRAREKRRRKDVIEQASS
ncbi:hypothetical protein QQ056_14805 [Oscillatoria laete-virens NRMC-F 0139]|nr:hypothetical protein [Oscillatoria laete-virens]MDL5054807.1 hypothetical protein [Oscillatoria laete-virens NRMC-F 0139]